MHPKVTRVRFDRWSRPGSGVIRLTITNPPLDAGFFNTLVLPSSGRETEIEIPVEGGELRLESLLPWERELVSPLVATLINELVTSESNDDAA